MMRFGFLMTLLFLSLPALVLEAQDSRDIVLSASFWSGALTLTWAPGNDTVWAEGNKYGYTLTRTGPDSRKVVLASGIRPRPMSWFDENKHLDNGFIYVIGRVLHDPEYNNQLAHELLTNQRIQYDYLVPEAIRMPMVAEALGLGYRDSACVQGLSYLYEVSFRDSSGRVYSSALEVMPDAEAGRYNQEALLDMKFTPPGDASLFSMRTDLPDLNRIEVVAKAYGDSIVLRWAPNNPVYWTKTRNEPYAVFRVRPGIAGDSIFTEYIFLDSVSAWPLERFTPEVVVQDSLVLVAAQCLHGGQESTEEEGFMIRHSESEMRYGMALLAADRSPMAAAALGLRYVDTAVRPGETYSYVIFSRAADHVMENGFAEVINQPDTFNRIHHFSASPRDGEVELVWSRLNDQRFSGYLLERSDDNGRSFKALNESPLLFIQNQYSSDDGNHHFLDTIAQNYVEYVYRIRGVDAFGDTSEAALLTTSGIDMTAPDMPVVYFAEADPAGSILLKWEMPEGNADLDRFHILLGASVDGAYEPVASDLSRTVRSYTYTGALNTDRSHYFMVVAQDTAGNQRACLPVYVHLVDSVPPAAPANLQGLIDSNGIVTITWDHGVEPDLTGYRVYMANNPEHEFSQITTEATPLNMWQDSIALLALDKEVYYKVVAVDRSHNHSTFSEALRLNRPDIVPPAAPAALPVSSGTEGIRINWMPSASNDVVAYIIYRRNVTLGDTAPQRIIRLQDRTATTWTDTSAITEHIYEYTVRAQDQSGLLSEASFPVKGRKIFDLATLRVTSLEAVYRKEFDAVYLRWEPLAGDSSANYRFYLYKSTNGTSWKKIRQLDSAALSYLDRDLKTTGELRYGIKVVASDGKAGAMTESQAVIYNKE